MFIRITAKRWLAEDVSFEIHDIARYPRARWLDGLIHMAEHSFADAFAKHELPREIVTRAITLFLEEVGDGRDLMKSYPEADEAGDDWRVLIEMVTPEAQARQSAALAEFLNSIPARRPEGRVIMTASGIKQIDD